MAVSKVKVRSASQGDTALSLERRGSDPMGETIPQAEAAEGSNIQMILGLLVEAKLELDALAPQVAAANERYDKLREQLDEALVEAELQSAGTIYHNYRVSATLAQIEKVTIVDKSKLLEYVKKHVPGLLTVNSQTWSAFLRNDAPGNIKSNPARVGCQLDTIPQLQLRITAIRAK